MIKIADLLHHLTQEGRVFYRNHILKFSDSDDPQNNLYKQVNNNRQIAQKEFNLHSTIKCYRYNLAFKLS
ncbi:MAG: hypothetical protein JXB49_28665 [Bacteroidales bacterium]|nr:hypothetical protein [Bacteroidales bacterium]